jgi:hypothetical protein
MDTDRDLAFSLAVLSILKRNKCIHSTDNYKHAWENTVLKKARNMRILTDEHTLS